ncbi:MAG: mannose-1-phosphate guanylyltransferase/mannose-6-phosphate isomerase, partial [Proteobacteria bacterium]|nr:mannose-1-phosphate guanylyltransferase/mannose-6-phosphate isomerase [Pseudomonadota bacterium]
AQPKGENHMLQPVILCGGVGSRLWPLSRTNLPKPFIPLMGEGNDQSNEKSPQTHTLFQQTAARVQGAGMHPPLVICAEQHRFFVLEQLARLGIKPAAVILEPTPRSTAPAIALAALWAQENGISDPLSLLPADHLMGSPAEFQQALKSAAPAAQSHIVLFGITPTFAHTEYGYIQHGQAHSSGIFKVTKFHEKPTRTRAEEMLKEGGYSWNSGMFTATAAVLVAELQSHAKQVWQGTQQAWHEKTAETLLGTTLIRPGSSFGQIPAEPFDTAVMERTAKAVVMPYQGRWSDIGTFSTLAEALPQDDAGNSLVGNDIVAQDADNSLVHSSTAGKVVAISGVSGLVVVDTP